MSTCVLCDKTPRAICQFCGRFVCQDHATLYPYLMSVFIDNGVPKVFTVPDAIWCTVCRPQPEPIEIPDFGGAGHSDS